MMKLKFFLYSLIVAPGLVIAFSYVFNNFTTERNSIDNKQQTQIVKNKKKDKTSESSFLKKDVSENNQLKPKYFEPSIEVFRVEPDGKFIIAGSGNPNSNILIKEKDKTLNSTIVDAKGKWILTSNQALSEGDHLFILEQQHEDGTFILSKNFFVTKINKNKKTKPMVFSLPNEDGGKLGIIQKQKKIEFKNTLDNSNYQFSTDSKDTIETEFKVTGIQFDDEGKISIYGTTTIGEFVEAELDGKMILTSNVRENTFWVINSNTPINYGHHSLEIKLLSVNKKVLDKIKLPFYRSELPENLLKDNYVIIEPGDMLWKIAYKVYGNGWKYLEIFDENKDQISNPDLIFPGQVFILPK